MKIDLPARLLLRVSALSAVPKSLLMMGLLSVWSSPLLAQDDPLRPPRTDDPVSGPKFLVMFIALLLAGLVIFASVLKSKRGHQD